MNTTIRTAAVAEALRAADERMAAEEREAPRANRNGTITITRAHLALAVRIGWLALAVFVVYDIRSGGQLAKILTIMLH